MEYKEIPRLDLMLLGCCWYDEWIDYAGQLETSSGFYTRLDGCRLVILPEAAVAGGEKSNCFRRRCRRRNTSHVLFPPWRCCTIVTLTQIHYTVVLRFCPVSYILLLFVELHRGVETESRYGWTASGVFSLFLLDAGDHCPFQFTAIASPT